MTRRTFYNQIADQAAEWVVHFDNGPLSADQRKALVAWLKESPAHVDEFLTTLALFEGAALADPAMSTEVSDILSDASADVVPLHSAASVVVEPVAETHTETLSPSGQRRRLWLGSSVAAAAALAIVSFGVLTQVQVPMDDGPQPLVLATELGEQRSVTLEDGSIVYVNTQSKISALYTDEARTVTLAYGEALFDVEKDPNRPFRVIAGDTVAEALGTTFNVRFIDDKAAVSVVEGTVAFSRQNAHFDGVERDEDPNESLGADTDTNNGNNANGNNASSDDLGRLELGRVILTAGQRVDLADPAVLTPRVGATDVLSVTAWTERKLVFDEMDLASIADEFNRYNRDRLVLGSSVRSAETFSGTFAADDPESFVAFLELTSGIKAQKRGREIRLEQTR